MVAPLDEGSGTRRQLSVVVASNAQLWLEALGALVGSIGDVEVVGSANDFERLSSLVPELLPQEALIDLPLPGLKHAETVLELRNHQPDICYIILASSDMDDRSLRAVASLGSVVVTTREASRSDLIGAMAIVRTQYTAIAPWLLPRILERPSSFQSKTEVKLTPREAEVLAGIAEGHTDRELSRVLGASPRTLQTILGKAKAKLGAVDRTNAAVLALKLGLLPVTFEEEGRILS